MSRAFLRFTQEGFEKGPQFSPSPFLDRSIKRGTNSYQKLQRTDAFWSIQKVMVDNPPWRRCAYRRPGASSFFISRNQRGKYFPYRALRFPRNIRSHRGPVDRSARTSSGVPGHPPRLPYPAGTRYGNGPAQTS